MFRRIAYSILAPIWLVVWFEFAKEVWLKSDQWFIYWWGIPLWVAIGVSIITVTVSGFAIILFNVFNRAT